MKAWPLYFDGLGARDGINYYPSKHDSHVPCSGRGLILAYLFVQTLIDSMDPDYGSGSNIGGLGLVFILGVAVIGLGIVIMIVQAIRRPAFFRGETLKHESAHAMRPHEHLVS